MNSYRSIQQIFYANKKFGVQEILNLQKYCLTNELCRGFYTSSEKNGSINTVLPFPPNTKIMEEISTIEKKEPPKFTELISKNQFEKTFQENSESTFQKPQIEKKEPPIPPKTMQSKFWIPPHQDTLFWSVFFTVFGLSEYNQVGHSYGNRILEEKMKIANYFKKNPKSLKSSNHKFTNESIQETIAELMVDHSISFKGLASLAIYYKRNIYVLDEKRKIYLKFTSPDTDSGSDSKFSSKIYIYYHDFMRGSHKYKIIVDDIVNIPAIDSWFCLENSLKPLKAISNYKVEDLIGIANIIGYEVPVKIKKPELYDRLVEKCGWYKIDSKTTREN